MKHFFTLFTFFLLIFHLNAQVADTTSQVTIITKNKQTFVGELIKISADSIVIRNVDLGVLSFNKKNIKKFHKGILSPYFKETTNSSVPYYVQTAIPNGDRNHYYRNYYIFGNEFNFGLSDNFNFTVGFETATLIFDPDNRIPIMKVGAKYGVEARENLYFGLSSKFYFIPEGSALMLEAPITFGNKRSNFTISPNYIRTEGFSNLGIFSNLSLSLSPQARFIIDYIHVDEANIAVILFEILFRIGFTLSIGSIVTIDGTASKLAFSIPFGKWKNKD